MSTLETETQIKREKTVFGKKENKCLCCVWLANGRNERTNNSGDTQTLFFVYAFAWTLARETEKERNAVVFLSCLQLPCVPTLQPQKEKGYNLGARKRRGVREICDKFQFRSKRFAKRKLCSLKRVEEGRSLNRNEKSWSQKCVEENKKRKKRH